MKIPSQTEITLTNKISFPGIKVWIDEKIKQSAVKAKVKKIHNEKPEGTLGGTFGLGL